MLQNEYKQYQIIANKFLKAGRWYWKDHIIAEDLLAEAFIVIADSSHKGAISEEIYWKALKTARARLVKQLLDGNLQLRSQHNYLVRGYAKRNPDKINKLAREGSKRRAIEKGTYRGKVGAPNGENHGKFVGLIITPYGTFKSSYDAGKAEGVSHRCIQYRCKQRDKFPEYYIKRDLGKGL